jgi:quinol-cytochrome oxidoreductase complex cytochrome b subunit/mono/diheme cytochrome c family protein
LLEPLPGGSRWAAAFGSLLAFSFLVQVVTGILLAMNYAPAVSTAWSSVRFIQEEVLLGRLIRAVHHWGASLMVILLLAHLIQVFVWGAYKRPREFTWMVGVLLLACTLGLAFTGYLLPWDEKAYWATKVGLGITSTVPLVGDSLRTLLQGGSEIGNLTLTRFFTLHGFVLPIVLTLLAVVHLYLFRVHGVTPRWYVSDEQLQREAEPFWPGQAWKDAVLALAVLVGLGLWCYFHPAPLGSRADPSQPYEARPEWYFMFLFRLLKYFEGPYEVLGTFVLPTLFFLVLFFWPLLDRNPSRDPRRRPLAISLLTLGASGLVGFTIYSIETDVKVSDQVLVASTHKAAAPAGPLQRMQVFHLYSRNCAACHGDDGTGSQLRAAMPTIPDFTNMAWQMSKTDLEIAHQIQNGQPPKMPSFRDKLSPAEMLGLTIYTRAFATPVQDRLARGTPASASGVASPKPAAVAPPEIPAKPEGIARLPEGGGVLSAGPAKPAPPAGAEEVPPPIPAAAVAAVMNADHIYRAYCLACHGEDGHGSAVRVAMPEIPDFTSAKWQSSRKDAELAHSILEGKGKFMLPMKDKVAAADTEAMVAYIRRFNQGGMLVQVHPTPEQGAATLPATPEPATPLAVAPPGKPPQVSPKAGPAVALAPSPDRDQRITVAATLYRQYCLTCHGPDARGTAIRAAMPAIPDFTAGSWQKAHSDAQLQASILNGKGALMPSFGGKISPREARDVIRYLRAFGPTGSAPLIAENHEGSFTRQFHELERQWNELQRQADRSSSEKPKP